MKIIPLKNLSIQAKLLLTFLVVIVICMSIFTAVVYVNFSKTIESENKNSVSQVLTLTENSMLQYIENVENILIGIQANQVIEKTVTSSSGMNAYEEINLIEKELGKIDIMRTIISELHFYVSNRPNYPNPTSSNVFPASAVENEEWYKNTISANGESYITVMDSSPTDGVLCVSKTFIDTRTHDIIGVMRADINLAKFTSDISQMTLGKTGKVFLVYNNHIINPWENSYIKSFINEQVFMNSILNFNEPQYVEINGIAQIIGSRRLYDDSLRIVCAAKYSEINNSKILMRNSLLLTFIIMIIVSFVLLAFVSQWITMPIRRLISYMADFKTNRKPLPDEMETKDEIGRLCAEYNALLNTIESLIEDVKTLYSKQKIFELKALQAQINPHFLYNTLDSINWMAKKHNAQDISKMTNALGLFFRHSLNKGYEYTTIDNEIQQIVSYSYIQNVRFENKFKIIYDIDEDILQCSIIKLSIQPLVENCIVHGFEEIDEGGIISIHGYSEDDYIYIDVCDNGRGCDTDSLNKNIQNDFSFDEPIEKYGLNNVNQRIKLYFDNTCGLHFETTANGGVCATIKIRHKDYEYKITGM